MGMIQEKEYLIIPERKNGPNICVEEWALGGAGCSPTVRAEDERTHRRTASGRCGEGIHGSIQMFSFSQRNKKQDPQLRIRMGD